jgi:hypothetical protein
VCRGQPAVVRGWLLCWEAVRPSRAAQDGRDEARGGAAWVDVMEVLGSGRSSLVGGERREGWRTIGSEGWPAWRADPQSMMTQRCTRRQQWLPVVVLGA